MFSIWAAGALLTVCRGGNTVAAGRSLQLSEPTPVSLDCWLIPDKLHVMPLKPRNLKLGIPADTVVWWFLFQEAACLHLGTIYASRIKQGQWVSWQCVRCLSVWPSLVGGGCSGRRARSQNTGWATKPSTRQWRSRRPAAAPATFRSGSTAPHVSVNAASVTMLKNKPSNI